MGAIDGLKRFDRMSASFPQRHDVQSPLKFITHSYRAAAIALRYGWLPGARYSNLRDARKFDRLGFLDISWADYSFMSHLRAVKSTQPMLTVARDVDDIALLERTLDQARELGRYADQVIIVPKDPLLEGRIDELIPAEFILGFSVPTRYGGTQLSVESFSRPVHLLGGRPDAQRRLANRLSIISLDCNRFTLDAAYGDYFTGTTFQPHPHGGYDTCLEASIENITNLWNDYKVTAEASLL